METQTTTKQQHKTNERDRRGQDDRPKRNFKKSRRRGRPAQKRPEFEQKIVSIRRVTRVMKGGRRFSFSVGMIAGDRKGRVGFGSGKAADTTLAIEKAYRQAVKKMVTIPMTKTKSISHDVRAKFNASDIIIKPARGRGLAAGSAVRDVLSLAGVTDVTGKILSRSKNKVNMVKATFMALEQLKSTQSQSNTK